MPTILDCPACSRKVRVTDDLIGHMVRCPTCGDTFAVSATASGLPGVAAISQDVAQIAAPTPEEKHEEKAQVKPDAKSEDCGQKKEIARVAASQSAQGPSAAGTVASR